MQPIFLDGLILRAFEDSDAEEYAQAARESADTVGRWMTWCTPSFSEQNALDWFKQCRDSLSVELGYEYGIFAADSGRFLGGAGLNSIDHQHLFCNLGYWVRSSEQRRRIASRAVQALVPYAFNTLGLHRIEIVVATGNEASEAVARGYGAHFECVARNRLQIHGAPVSAKIFSIVP
ncbi:GNAT family N-acetyltransferase [Bordetella sp. N]|uniref:GNAT family N-acetyltransferase n=1 Tax=Bordetella sp. N TaxID=1746199 RepID=UPI00070B1C90|nr:GNAT family N-acetyltransferase [Bordetella sp. N]ALM82604.1 acetyltransferase [Bordetella sp. N]